MIGLKAPELWLVVFLAAVATLDFWRRSAAVPRGEPGPRPVTIFVILTLVSAVVLLEVLDFIEHSR